MQHDHRGHRPVTGLLTATGPATRWVTWDELPTTITTVWWAESRSRRQPSMPGVMAQIPHQAAAGRLVFRAPGRLGQTPHSMPRDLPFRLRSGSPGTPSCLQHSAAGGRRVPRSCSSGTIGSPPTSEAGKRHDSPAADPAISCAAPGETRRSLVSHRGGRARSDLCVPRHQVLYGCQTTSVVTSSQQLAGGRVARRWWYLPTRPRPSLGPRPGQRTCCQRGEITRIR